MADKRIRPEIVDDNKDLSGSGFGNTVKELQPSAPNAQIMEGRPLNRADIWK